MHSRLLNWIGTMLCLLTFGVQALAGAHVVRCTDGSGSSRLEWGGCERDAHGQCAMLATGDACHEGETEGTVPCEDTPLNGELRVAAPRMAAALHSIELPAPVLVLMAQPPLVFAMRPSMRVSVARTEAGPPTASVLCTIVMLV